MKDKARRIYDEISQLFQDGDGSIECEMLDNLFDILNIVDDDFLEHFSYKVNNELYEDEEDEGDDEPPMYDDPAVTFISLGNKRIYFRVECGGVACVNPEHSVFSEEGYKYPSCFIPNDVVVFKFGVNDNNEKIAREFVDYFTKHFMITNKTNNKL